MKWVLKNEAQSQQHIRMIIYLLELIIIIDIYFIFWISSRSGGVLFLFSGLQLWNHNKQKDEQRTQDWYASSKIIPIYLFVLFKINIHLRGNVTVDSRCLDTMYTSLHVNGWDDIDEERSSQIRVTRTREETGVSRAC